MLAEQTDRLGQRADAEDLDALHDRRLLGILQGHDHTGEAVYRRRGHRHAEHAVDRPDPSVESQFADHDAVLDRRTGENALTDERP